MAALSGYSRNTFYGHLPSGEIFNWSLWANGAPIGAAATQTQANSLAATAKLAGNGVNNVVPWKLLGADSGLDGVRVYSYQEDNTRATNIADASIGMVGNSTATALLPNQCAVVVTLKSAIAGRRHQGRIYIPINKWQLSSQAQLSLTDATGIAGWFAELLGRINPMLPSASKVGILSRVGMNFTPPRDPTFQACVSVTVDTKIDIQRRRANKAPANNRFTQTVA